MLIAGFFIALRPCETSHAPFDKTFKLTSDGASGRYAEAAMLHDPLIVFFISLRREVKVLEVVGSRTVVKNAFGEVISCSVRRIL